MSWRRALYLRTDRRNHFTTTRLLGSAEKARESWLGSQGWQLKFWKYISVVGESPWEVCGLNPKLGSSAYSTRTQKKNPPKNKNPDNTQLWKTVGFLPARKRWLETEPLKGPMHKISFVATYLGLQQRQGRVE